MLPETKSKPVPKCSLIVALLSLLVGVLGLLLIAPTMQLVMHHFLALVPSNPGYQMWRDIPVPIFQRFYLFNVTNPTQVEREGAKPILAEVGPFVYRVQLARSGIEFNSDRSEVSFHETKQLYLDRQKSVSDPYNTTVYTTCRWEGIIVVIVN